MKSRVLFEDSDGANIYRLEDLEETVLTGAESSDQLLDFMVLALVNRLSARRLLMAAIC